jgi:ribosomal protein S10
MSKNKMAALQNALKPKPAPPTPEPHSERKITSYKAPSRAGKTNLTAYLSPDYKRNMRLIQAKTGLSLQSLIAEALNDLFVKHGVSTIDYKQHVNM